MIDCSTVVAGPRIAMYLGDFGADVIKIEHPVRGDDTRHFGAERDGVSMYWKLVSLNKRCITLNTVSSQTTGDRARAGAH